MANRMIRYGYGYEKGKIVIISNEAEIVKQIFNWYLDGKSLKEIAEELQSKKIEYFNGNYSWNKNTINRILECDKYTGVDERYPEIISPAEFKLANSLKIGKCSAQDELSETLKYLKIISKCGECNNILVRKPDWSNREKWMCNNGCRCKKYIDDKALLEAVSYAIERAKVEIESYQPSEEETYSKTPEIIKYSNEITRNSTTGINFNSGKKLILEYVNLKFQACKENKSISYNEKVKRILQNKNLDTSTIIKEIISDIYLFANGTINVKFINNLIV